MTFYLVTYQDGNRGGMEALHYKLFYDLSDAVRYVERELFSHRKQYNEWREKGVMRPLEVGLDSWAITALQPIVDSVTSPVQ